MSYVTARLSDEFVDAKYAGLCLGDTESDPGRGRFAEALQAPPHVGANSRLLFQSSTLLLPEMVDSAVSVALQHI